MKLQNIILSSLLAFQSVNANTISNKVFNYNFYCVKNNKGICSTLEKEVVKATNSLANILDIPEVNFEVFVDDASKYRLDDSKDVLAIALDSNFEPLNSNNKNIESPYPNAKALKRKLNLKKDDDVPDKDFFLLLNSFKSNKKFLESFQDDHVSTIIEEIMEALGTLEKLPYPYVKEKVDESFKDNPPELVIAMLTLRKNDDVMNDIALGNQKSFDKFAEANKLPSIIHWKDTLLGKGNKDFSRDKYDYRRIVVVGDIHGDYDKLKSVLRHAKLIDDNDDWIGTDSILMQLGDLMDRGPDFKFCIELLIKLRAQARERGGIVYMLLGNHELYNMQAGYFLISKPDFDNFGGMQEREKCINLDGKYGKLIRSDMNLTMVVDDNLFAHAGIPLEFAKRGVDQLNKDVHDFFTNLPPFDDILNDYYYQGKTHPLYTDPLVDMNTGPFWTNFFTDPPEEEVCGELNEVLETVGAKRMFVGHRVQKYGKIRTRCQNKLIMMDIGLSRCLGNYFGYVEILNDKKEIWARYQ